MSSTNDKLNNIKSSLAEERLEHEGQWEENITHVYPILNKYLDDYEWSDNRYDMTASLALALASDGLFGSTCSPNLSWFAYRFSEDELNDVKEYAEYLDEVQKHMYNIFEESNFYAVTPKAIRQCQTVGTVIGDHTFDQEQQRHIITLGHPMENYLAVDEHGAPMVRVREFPMSAAQAQGLFGKDQLPNEVKESLRTNPFKEHIWEHFMMPRSLADDEGQMPYVGYIRLKGDEKIVRRFNYRKLPGVIWYWEQRANDAYGYSPTHDAMPAILTINQMIRTLLLYAEKIADPVAWLPSERAQATLNPGSREIYTDPSRIGAYQQMPGGFPVTWEMVQWFVEAVKDAYKVNHYLMLMATDQGNMTAREVMERKSEKLTVTGSTLGNFESAWLTQWHYTLMAKEIELGRMPQPPEGAEELLMQPIKISYQGPLAQARKEMQVVQGIVNVITYIQALQTLDPIVIKKVRAEKLAEEILEVYGTPEEAIVGEREYMQEKRRAEEQAQAATQAQIGQVQAQGMQQAAQAAELAQGGGRR